MDYHTPIPQLQVQNHHRGETPPHDDFRQKKPNRDMVNVLIVRLMVLKKFSLKRQTNIRLYLNILFSHGSVFMGLVVVVFFCGES